MEINIPEIVAELTEVFGRYEAALTSNDVATLNALFWESGHTLRYGIGENLYGSDEILAFRSARSSVGLQRHLERTVITTFGHVYGTTATLFRRDNDHDRIGRQLQTWVRFPQGWRVVAAHVSMIERPTA